MSNYYLKPIYDSALSFYNKAEVMKENGTMQLRSYDTIVCSIKNDNVVIYANAHEKALGCTTLRHIKEFLKQHGYKAESKKQLIADYVKEC